MTLFAGFSSLEQLLEHIDHDRPVYALSITDTVSGERGLDVHKTAILISQPQAGDLVNYVRIPTASIEYLYGQPFSRNADERNQRALDAWTTVLAYLDAQGIETLPAVIAMPKDLQLLDARAECLRSDPQPAEAVPSVN